MAPQSGSDDRSRLLNILDETRRDMHAAVEGLWEAEASANPGPGRWSVLECVEHVTLVEQRFRGWLDNGDRVEVPPIDKQREARLLERVADRSQRAQAPEPVVPVGRFASLAEALQAFDKARAETVRFAEARYAELYSLASSHPRLGRLNGYEFVLLIAAHGRRHAAQIRETRAALAGA
jgi:uncharacterized damage-inducible protein DinB